LRRTIVPSVSRSGFIRGGSVDQNSESVGARSPHGDSFIRDKQFVRKKVPHFDVPTSGTISNSRTPQINDSRMSDCHRQMRLAAVSSRHRLDDNLRDGEARILMGHFAADNWPVRRNNGRNNDNAANGRQPGPVAHRRPSAL
jgi:hypothetical protein